MDKPSVVYDKEIATLYKLLENFDNSTLDNLRAFFYDALKMRDTQYKITLNENRILYRARYGCIQIPGAIDDLSISVTTPYFREGISAPPTSLTKKGRFNREGESYLYLSTTKETCISELKLDVGQICSVAKFKSTKNGDYLNFIYDFDGDEFFRILKTLFLYPVHSSNENYYLFTQIISDVIKELNYRGIFYPSTQLNISSNFNIVGFYPSDFSFVDYSDELYKIKSVKYTIEKEEESYRQFFDYDELLNDYNDEDVERKKKVFDYIDAKTKYEQDNNLYKIKKRGLI